jgi:hypothetical protein
MIAFCTISSLLGPDVELSVGSTAAERTFLFRAPDDRPLDPVDIKTPAKSRRAYLSRDTEIENAVQRHLPNSTFKFRLRYRSSHEVSGYEVLKACQPECITQYSFGHVLYRYIISTEPLLSIPGKQTGSTGYVLWGTSPRPTLGYRVQPRSTIMPSPNARKSYSLRRKGRFSFERGPNDNVTSARSDDGGICDIEG